MDTARDLEIGISKVKASALTFGAMAMIAVGLRLLTLDDATIRAAIGPLRNPLFAHAVGLAGMVFFGLCAVVGVRKLFDARPGLKLGARGIVDNSSGVAAGFIPWTDILGSHVYAVMNQRMLVITLRNPEKYIDVGNPARRWLNRANFRMCGSPVVLASNALKTDFDALVATFEAYRTAHGNRD